MNTAHQSLFWQRGYGGIEALLIGVAFATLMYFFMYPPKFSPIIPTADESACVIDPAISPKSVVLDGKEYVLIKRRALTIEKQVTNHFGKLGTLTIQQKPYPYYKVWLDELEGPAEGGTYRPITGAEYLRFVDVSSESAKPVEEQGYIPLDIYLEKGQSLPQFIQNYCNDLLPHVPIFFDQDTFGVSLPPVEINTGPNADWQPATICGGSCSFPRPDQKYRIFAYEKRGSNSYGVSTDPTLTGNRMYTFTKGGQTATFKAYFLANSSTETITLVPQDGSDIAYKYTPLLNVLYLPSILNLHNKSDIQADMVQIEGFVPFTVPPWGWWTPECKPAIYLYPEKETLVNVKVAIPNGFLTYTDPVYPHDTGWTVLAKPSGELQYLGATLSDSKNTVNYPSGIFPYLYYEGKVHDSAIEKPSEGFVTQYHTLQDLLEKLLPQLGLQKHESDAFIQYWMQALPQSPYYFVGIIPQEQLNTIEPLTITPEYNSLIRVRLYFEPLAKPILVQNPPIQTPQRKGFTVVDWGGMVKADKNHPFTCLQ